MKKYMFLVGFLTVAFYGAGALQTAAVEDDCTKAENSSCDELTVSWMPAGAEVIWSWEVEALPGDDRPVYDVQEAGN